MKNTMIKKISLTAIFAVMLVLLGTVLMFGTSATAAHAAQENNVFQDVGYSPAAMGENYFKLSPPDDYYGMGLPDFSKKSAITEWDFYAGLNLDGHSVSPVAPRLLVYNINQFNEGSIKVNRLLIFVQSPSGATVFKIIPGSSITAIDPEFYLSSFMTFEETGFYKIFAAVDVGVIAGGPTSVYRLTEMLALHYGPQLMPLPAAPTPPDGYYFFGWYLDQDFSNPYIGQPISADTDLYAKFDAITYTITYVVPGGTAISAIEYNVETATFTLPTAVAELQSFVGWYASADFSGQPITQIPKGTTGNKTLYAKFGILKHTVTFYVGGNVYTKIDVPHGASLATVLAQAEFLQYSAQSVEYSPGFVQTITGGDFFAIENAASVYMEEKTGVDSALGWAQANWQALVGGCALIGVLALILFAVRPRKASFNRR